MNGTTLPASGRSVQLAVMAAPTTTIVEAVAAARRRNEPSIGGPEAVGSSPARRLAVATA